MIEHYYIEKPKSKFMLYKIKTKLRGNEIELYSASGLFSPKKIDKGTRILIENCIVKSKWKILDLGCGYGAVGISLKRSFPNLDVLFSDINERAVEITKKNVKKYNIKAKVVKSDGFENVKEDFNSILLNPPQTAGKKICFKLIEHSKNHLVKGGLLQIVARHNKGGRELSKKMEEVFGNMKDIVKKAGYRVYISENR